MKRIASTRVLQVKAWGVRRIADVQSRWSDFRATSIYFQLRTLVLVVYGGLVAFTAFYLPVDGINNAIGARVTILDGDLVVGRYFIVANEGRKPWRNVVLELDGGFRFEQDVVAAGTQLEVFSTSFRKKEMRKRRGREIAKWLHASPEAELTKLTIDTHAGSASARIFKRGEQPRRWF